MTISPPGDSLRLVESRDASRCATEFRNPATGLPEPVLAIYQPAILPILERAKLTCRYSLMLLRDVPVHLIEAESVRELLNINDPNDYREYRPSYARVGRKD
jgi:molybdopterin-guanine dinucleotide biosynthesis protein A